MPLSFYKLVSKHEHKLVYQGSLYLQLHAPLKRQKASIMCTPRKETERRLGRRFRTSPTFKDWICLCCRHLFTAVYLLKCMYYEFFFSRLLCVRHVTAKQLQYICELTLTISSSRRSAARCGALRTPRGCALPVKYGSINRRSAINFYLSVLIYPIMALGCFAMSNVLWRWAFHILYCFPFLSLSLFFLPPSTKKLCSHFCEIKAQRERGGGWRGAEDTMKFNPFKTVSFSDHTSGRWVFIGGTGEAEITGLVIVSSKSAELWGTPSAVFHQTRNERVKGQS